MRPLRKVSILAVALAASIGAVPMAALAGEAAPSAADPREAGIASALDDIATYAGNVLLTDEGRGRADYHMVPGKWVNYEDH